MSIQEAPLTYAAWNLQGQRTFRRVSPFGRWPGPRVMVHEGAVWEEIPEDPGDWCHLGWVPAPRTRLGWFLYSWRHGRMMGYPSLHVFIFSLKHAGLMGGH